MKFGVRDICDVVFKAKNNMTIGSSEFVKGQPVLYIDTATASTLEQATTSVYAQGGKGNTRLVTWEGEKTLTFTVTDALLSPVSLSILSGAGLFKSNKTSGNPVHVHVTAKATYAETGSTRIIDLSAALSPDTSSSGKFLEYIDPTAPIFISKLDANGDLTGELVKGGKVANSSHSPVTTYNAEGTEILFESTPTNIKNGDTVFVDFYITKESNKVNEIQIDATSFGGNFYVEASTLFRAEDGKDYPAEITIPNVKIQSNFTFSMAATGDPSTFDFTMDAMPDYTYFDNSRKMMCVIQVVEDTNAGTVARETVMGHKVEGWDPANTEGSDAEDSVANG